MTNRREHPSYRGRRGVCGHCHERHGLTADGLLVVHFVVLHGPRCDGSLTAPIAITDKKKGRS